MPAGLLPALWDLRNNWLQSLGVLQSSRCWETYLHALYLSWKGLIAGDMPAFNDIERCMAIGKPAQRHQDGCWTAPARLIV